MKATLSGEEEEQELAETHVTSANGCHGKERWNTKTGADENAKKVKLTPITKPVSYFLTVEHPEVNPGDKPTKLLPDDQRFAPTETQTYVIKDATLVCAKEETGKSGDLDFHIVVRQGTAHDNVEIPDPDCVADESPFLKGITKARAAFVQRQGDRTKKIPRCTGEVDLDTADAGPISVYGVGFFDKVHNDIGVSKTNGIELHPVLGVCFTKGCDPTH